MWGTFPTCRGKQARWKRTPHFVCNVPRKARKPNIMKAHIIPLFLIAWCFLFSSARAQQFEWQQATPESQGLSAAKLDALKDDLAKRKTRAFLVIRNDRIVYEWYADGQTAAKPQGTASLAKAVVGGLVAGRRDHRRPDRTRRPGREVHPRMEGRSAEVEDHDSPTRLAHVGVGRRRAAGVPHDKQPGWKGDFWKRLPPPNDPFTIARDRAPVLFEPGTKLQYSNPGIGMLTYCRHGGAARTRRRRTFARCSRPRHAAHRRRRRGMVGRLRQDVHGGRPAAGGLVGRRQLHAAGHGPHRPT